MQCSQLHQIAENYSRALQPATFSELNHTLAQTGAVLGGKVGGAVHVEIIHISTSEHCLHRSVPMSHITIVCIPYSCGDPLFLPVGGIDQPTDKLYLHKISLTQIGRRILCFSILQVSSVSITHPFFSFGEGDGRLFRIQTVKKRAHHQHPAGG